jgi:hypothetical protein
MKYEFRDQDDRKPTADTWVVPPSQPLLVIFQVASSPSSYLSPPLWEICFWMKYEPLWSRMSWQTHIMADMVNATFPPLLINFPVASFPLPLVISNLSILWGDGNGWKCGCFWSSRTRKAHPMADMVSASLPPFGHQPVSSFPPASVQLALSIFFCPNINSLPCTNGTILRSTVNYDELSSLRTTKLELSQSGAGKTSEAFAEDILLSCLTCWLRFYSFP